MNIVICLIIFCIINYWGLKYVTSSASFAKPSLLNLEQKVSFSGLEMFLLLTLSCAIIASAPLGLLAIRLLLWLIFLLIGLIKIREKSFGWCAFFYLLYLAYLLLSLTWSPAPIYGFRVFLKYLLPFLVLLLFPQVVQNEELFPYAVKWTCRTLIAWVVYEGIIAIGLGILLTPIGGIWWWGPAILDSFSIFLPLVVIASVLFSNKRYLWLIAAMAIIPLIGYVVRTGLVALFISAIAMAVFHYKLKSVPFLIILVLCSFFALVYIPQLREKMFFEQYATEEYASDFANWSMDAIDTSGRTNIWDNMLTRFWRPKPWMGSGAGVSQDYMYKTDDYGVHIAHCDYVQILCDNGLIGIILYAVALLTMIIHSFFLYNDHKRHRYCRYAAFIAGTGMCGMAAAMMTDNVVNYTMCTLVFPFSFYAIALGCRKFTPVEEKKDVQRHYSIIQ